MTRTALVAAQFVLGKQQMRVCPVREEEQDSTVADLAELVFLYKVGRTQILYHLSFLRQTHKALPEGPTLVGVLGKRQLNKNLANLNLVMVERRVA